VTVRARSRPPEIGSRSSGAERRVGIAEIVGSNPTGSSKCAGVAQTAERLVCSEDVAGSRPAAGLQFVDRCGVAEARWDEREVVALVLAGSNPVGHPGTIDASFGRVLRERTGLQNRFCVFDSRRGRHDL
jgi:hypothetical protein